MLRVDSAAALPLALGRGGSVARWTIALRSLSVPKTCATWADALWTPSVRTVPGGQVSGGPACNDLRLVGLKLMFLVVTRAVAVLGLSRREGWGEDAGILLLGHPLPVARRGRARGPLRLRWPEPARLACVAA